MTVEQSKFEVIADVLKDAIVIADDKDIIIFWNKAAVTMFGYKSAEVLGKQLHKIIPLQMDNTKFKHDFSQFGKTGKNWVVGGTFDLEVKRKDKSSFNIELSVGSYKEKGHWLAVGIMRDISARKQMEKEFQERLEESEKFNQLMVGRELKMIELKEEISRLKAGELVKKNSNKYEKGIELEEKVIRDLGSEYHILIKDATLPNDVKNNITAMLDRLIEDSQGHEKALMRLENYENK
jgi:PAS domain S-box-containing protein